MMKNKRGWIRIVEAFVAVLLITGVVLVLMNRGYLGKQDTSEKIYEIEISILREIELNNNLREEVLNYMGEVPVELTQSNFPQVYAKIGDRISEYDYLNWKAMICKLDEVCTLSSYDPDKEVYAQSVAIAATSQTYSPKQLKLFVWMK